jgi:hypothetical protein
MGFVAVVAQFFVREGTLPGLGESRDFIERKGFVDGEFSL